MHPFFMLACRTIGWQKVKFLKQDSECQMGMHGRTGIPVPVERNAFGLGWLRESLEKKCARNWLLKDQN